MVDPPQGGGAVTFSGATTGYDEVAGNDKCYAEVGDKAALLGVSPGNPIWKHLQGTTGDCAGKDFWVYDDGVL